MFIIFFIITETPVAMCDSIALHGHIATSVVFRNARKNALIPKLIILFGGKVGKPRKILNMCEKAL